MVGSLTGRFLQSVTEDLEGSLSASDIAPQVQRHKRLDCEPDKASSCEAGLSDPVVLYRRAIAQRTKGTPGITG